MRLGAYHLFEIVAWPAAVWCAVELVLRGASGGHAGMAMPTITGLCAGFTIVACRLRSAQLAAQDGEGTPSA